jgi:hypothetical protein
MVNNFMNSGGVMRNLVCVLTALLAPVSLLCAQSQVATATSSASFQLRGATVSTDQGVPYWPIMPGDAIKAGSAPVVITFAGGSSITLGPGSSAAITMSGQTPTFALECGTARYVLSALSAVKLNDPASPPKVSGSYTLSCGKPAAAAGWWTTGHTLLVLGGAAAAAGLAFGVTHAINGGPPVSQQ